MSHDYEVPGHHEHALEHEAHRGIELSQQIAIFTAILATLGAIVSYLGGHTQNEALFYKNEAVLQRAEASDQWAFYQAKAIKQHLAEMAADSASDPVRAAKLREDAARYAADREQIKAKAEGYERRSADANMHSERALRPHERLALAMTLIQIAISAASITALTRRRWLFAIAGAAALGGLATGVLAFLV